MWCLHLPELSHALAEALRGGALRGKQWLQP